MEENIKDELTETAAGTPEGEENSVKPEAGERRKKIIVISAVSVLALAIIAAVIILVVKHNRSDSNTVKPDNTYVDAGNRTDEGSKNNSQTDDSRKGSSGNTGDSQNGDEGQQGNSSDSSTEGSDKSGKKDTSAKGSGSHVDADNNGKCDACGAKMSVEVDFYAINDLHGKFDDSYGQPGVDELTTYLRERTLVDEHAIFLSSGDMWQGSAESNQTEGAVIIDWMNELGFVSMTLGNHEFDWGEDIIAMNSGKAQFPFLAINVYSRDTLEQVPYCKSSVMVDAGNVKIGIIGAVGDCYSSIAADQSQGFYIITGDELTQLVKEESLKLRAEGANFIVYSIHDGYSDSFKDDSSEYNRRVKVLADSRLASYYDVALSGEYVDLVFEGHTHQNYIVMDTKNVYHLQDGGENDGISHVQVVFKHEGVPNAGANESGTYAHECTGEEIVLAGYYSRRESDSMRDEILARYEDRLAFTKNVLGYNPYYLDRDELRQILARLYYKAGCKRWGTAYKIALGGGFMSVRDPRHLEAGDVTYADLQALFPFDNELVLCSCSGYDLKRVFLNSMNDNYFIYSDQSGTPLKLEDVVLNDTYYVVTDTYTSTYEPNNLVEVERYGSDLYARDLLANMFRAGGESVEDYFERCPEAFPQIDSSTARKPITEAIYRHFITMYDNDDKAKFPMCSKTHGAWLNLADGKADLVFLVKPTAEEADYFRERKVDVECKLYGCDGLAFIVSPNAEVKSLTKEQIKGIFEGKITNWKELGGPDHAIHPFIRDAQSGSQRLFEQLMWPDGDVPDFSAHLDSSFDFYYEYYDSMEGVTYATNADPYAIGYNIVSYLNNEFLNYIDLVTVDGAYPDSEHFADRSYPFTTEAYVAIRADASKGSAARRLYDWIGSDECDWIVSLNSTLSIVDGESEILKFSE